MRGVEDRDDEDRTDVVRDGERNEEDFQAARDAVPQQRHHPDCERDVGCHRHAPTARARAGRVGGEVDERRCSHASDSREDGQQCLASFGEFADEDLALDLEADDEEEQRHERFVDPVQERLREMQLVGEEPGLDLPHTCERHADPGVGQQKRKNRCAE